MTEIVDHTTFQIRRGEQSFARGEPWPPYSGTDRLIRAFWLGYHAARMSRIAQRLKARRALGLEDEI